MADLPYRTGPHAGICDAPAVVDTSNNEPIMSPSALLNHDTALLWCDHMARHLNAAWLSGKRGDGAGHMEMVEEIMSKEQSDG